MGPAVECSKDMYIWSIKSKFVFQYNLYSAKKHTKLNIYQCYQFIIFCHMRDKFVKLL